MIAMAGLNGCISFDSYIKPQHSNCWYVFPNVVYLLIPTSNHNLCSFGAANVQLYIF